MFIVPITQMLPLTSVAEGQQSGQAAVQTSGIPFADFLSEAVQNTKEAQKIAEQDSYDLAMGTNDNLTEIMINSSRASVALDMTIQLTTRAVNAYKEIMQIQA